MLKPRFTRTILATAIVGAMTTGVSPTVLASQDDLKARIAQLERELAAAKAELQAAETERSEAEAELAEARKVAVASEDRAKRVEAELQQAKAQAGQQADQGSKDQRAGHQPPGHDKKGALDVDLLPFQDGQDQWI